MNQINVYLAEDEGGMWDVSIQFEYINEVKKLGEKPDKNNINLYLGSADSLKYAEEIAETFCVAFLQQTGVEAPVEQSVIYYNP